MDLGSRAKAGAGRLQDTAQKGILKNGTSTGINPNIDPGRARGSSSTGGTGSLPLAVDIANSRKRPKDRVVSRGEVIGNVDLKMIWKHLCEGNCFRASDGPDPCRRCSLEGREPFFLGEPRALTDPRAECVGRRVAAKRCVSEGWNPTSTG
jgi:hypothetical protein